MTICVGTGHRPPKLGGYSPTAIYTVTQFARRAVDFYRRPENGELKCVISGMALGWDTALAQAAVFYELPFMAYIPDLDQANKWPQASRDLYNELLSKACHVKVCIRGEYHPANMQIRNEYMVDDCQVVLALWDGKSGGGTYNCVKYAERWYKPVVNLWPVWQQFLQKESLEWPELPSKK